MQSDAHFLEKRRFPRLENNLPAIISHEQFHVKESTCKNISEGGVCLEVEFEDVNEKALWVIHSNEIKINIEISLSDGTEKIKAKAVTRWEKGTYTPSIENLKELSRH